jgi:hypothetical protein
MWRRPAAAHSAEYGLPHGAPAKDSVAIVRLVRHKWLGQVVGC